jgi:hypothetical protein
VGTTIREVYAAKVTEIEDPEKRGRIKVTCREIGGEDVELPEWIEPCYPFAGTDGAAGFFFLPAVGDFVEIERAVGNTDDDAVGMGAIITPDSRWRCALYLTATDLPTEFTSGTYGKRMGFVTPGGNMLIFDEEQSAMFLIATTLIKLGSEQAAQPFVLGLITQTLLSSLIQGILDHNHTHPQGPTTGLDPASVTTFTALKVSPVDDGAMLSQKILGE